MGGDTIDSEVTIEVEGTVEGHQRNHQVGGMTTFLDKLVEGGREVLEDPDKYLGDPSKLLNLGLKFVSQDVLDGLIDKVLEATRESIMSEGTLDPVSIPDITIPYSLDKMTGACAPFLKEKHGALGELMLALCTCLAKNINLEGDLFLKDGSLSGLSQLTRSVPTLLQVENGVAKILIGLGVTGLEAPFTTSASIASPDFHPEVKAIVEKIGIKFGVDVPLSGASSTTGLFEFDPPLDDLPVDVDIKLDELGELEQVVKPLVIQPVKKKLIEILKGELKEKITEKISKFIPGVSALT